MNLKVSVRTLFLLSTATIPGGKSSSPVTTGVQPPKSQVVGICQILAIYTQSSKIVVIHGDLDLEPDLWQSLALFQMPMNAKFQ